MTGALRRPPRAGVEWEFATFSLSRELSKNVVRRLLVDRAERGGWELARTRIGADGTRQVTLRRKIIRQRQDFIFVG